MGKDKKSNLLDDLDVDADLLKPQEDENVDVELNEFLSTIPQAPRKLQAHLLRRSLQREQNQWNDILLNPEDTLYMKFPSKLAAQSKRTRLYHARTYLMLTYAQVKEYNYIAEQLAAYSLSIVERSGTFYIAILNLGIEAEELLTPDEVE
ncbi:hypothetical protein LCGC14_0483640 [marine sediment metagenome]|uniref:Uncharacterized protein n=1 Tax=marine sediment metagenome TaxID=412755 RepID=A0A0F9VHA9_9ZZZZ